MNARIKAKEFCLSDFGIHKVHYPSDATYDSSRGKDQTYIGYMQRGSCVFSSTFSTVECNAGDIVYIPEGLRYTSQSRGDPDVVCYCIQFSFRTDKDGKRFDRRYGMQKVCGVSAADFGNRFLEIYELLSRSDELSKIAAVGRFYTLFYDILPHLDEAKAPDYSLPVTRAIEYIDAHAAENFSMAQLAKECFVSESRLYHLFNEEMKTSPVVYRNEVRIIRSIEYIKTGYQTVEQISAALGFRSASYFRRVFKDITGMTPTEYRKKYSML